MKKIILLILFPLLFSGCVSETFKINNNYTKSLNLENENFEINNDAENNNEEFKTVDIGKGYSGSYGYDYFISISDGNESVCVWRYYAGNGNIPYIETTFAKTINEKHKITLPDAFWDSSVYCFDDWGNNYKGYFNNNN